MNPLFVDILVVILLFLVVLVFYGFAVVRERVSRGDKLVEQIQSRIGEHSATLIDMDTNLPKVKLMELQELFGALKSEFDGQIVANDAFRQKCTNQMQRFDSIMRRNKAVLAKGGTVTAVAEAGDDHDDEDAPLPQRFLAENPQALGPSQPSHTPTVGAGERDERRAAMRKKWKENRGL